RDSALCEPPAEPIGLLDLVRTRASRKQHAAPRSVDQPFDELGLELDPRPLLLVAADAEVDRDERPRVRVGASYCPRPCGFMLRDAQTPVSVRYGLEGLTEPSG